MNICCYKTLNKVTVFIIIVDYAELLRTFLVREVAISINCTTQTNLFAI